MHVRRFEFPSYDFKQIVYLSDEADFPNHSYCNHGQHGSFGHHVCDSMPTKERTLPENLPEYYVL